MAEYDPNNPGVTYNTMQQQAGLIPPFAAAPPPVMYPGQVSAMIAQGGPGAAFMSMGSAGTSFGAGMFPSQQLQGFTNQSPMLRGPTGVMMPMPQSAQMNPYAGANPYAGLASSGPYSGPAGIYTPMAPMAPPAYAGWQGTQAVPFAPAPAQSMFQNPYAAGLAQHQAMEDRTFSTGMSTMGIGARMGTNAAFGALGAFAGNHYGGRVGAVLGGLAGFMGSEMGGAGQFGQNLMMNNVAAPMINQRGYAAGIEHLSSHFMSGGPYGHASGMGFSHHASQEAAAGLESMSNSAGFRRSTNNMFNQNDVMKMTQMAGHEGMLDGSQSPGQMVARMKEVAKSVGAFMELANEPDIQRAIQTMGQMRGGGLNLSQTMNAVSNGRAFARMAGSSFQELSEIGGGMGSQTYQAMGLSQGLGYQVGMGNYGMARNAQLSGAVNPQMMALMGGPAGMANMNNMFSASMLQMPMMAPGVMTANGGISADAMRGTMNGTNNIFSQTARGANALTGMTGRMGAEGLGMAVAMQPLIQDTMGHMMEAQGPFARRNMEDRQMLGAMRGMNMRGSAGFMTMAQSMGMDRTQALARATEMGDPRYWNRQHEQLDVRRQERRADEIRTAEANEPGMLDTAATHFGAVASTMNAFRDAGIVAGGIGDYISHGGHQSSFRSTSAYDVRRGREFVRGGGLARASRAHEARLQDGELTGNETRRGYFDRVGVDSAINQASGAGSMVAGFEAAMGAGTYHSEATRSRAIRDLRQGSRLTGSLLHGSAASERAGMAASGRIFGGSEGAASDFSARLAGLYNNGSGLSGMGMGASTTANAAFRGGAMYLSDGFVDPGNIAGSRAVHGSDIQNAYVASMRQHNIGANDDARRQMFRDHGEQIVSARGSLTRLMMTDEGRSRADRSQRAVRAISDDPGNAAATRERSETEAYQSILGNSASGIRGEHFRRGFDDLMNAVGEPLGRTPQEQEFSRSYVAAAASLSRQLNDPNKREAATRRLQELDAEAARRGMSHLRPAMRMRADVVGQRIASQNGRAHDTARQMDLTTGSVSSMLRRFGRADRGRAEIEATNNVSEGIRILSGSEGERGNLFKNVRRGDGSIDMSTLEQNIQTIGGDSARMGQLREQDSGMADLVRQAARGGREGEAAMNRLLRRPQDLGVRGRRARDEYHGMSMATRAWRSIFNGGEEGFVAEKTAGGTAADERAITEAGNTTGTEEAARSAGVGGPNDQLVVAARELRQAARELRGSVEGNGLNSMIGGDDD